MSQFTEYNALSPIEVDTSSVLRGPPILGKASLENRPSGQVFGRIGSSVISLDQPCNTEGRFAGRIRVQAIGTPKTSLPCAQRIQAKEWGCATRDIMMGSLHRPCGCMGDAITLKPMLLELSSGLLAMRAEQRANLPLLLKAPPRNTRRASLASGRLSCILS